MKKLSLTLMAGIISFSVVGCNSQTAQLNTNQIATNSNVDALAKKANPEVQLETAKFETTDFSKKAASSKVKADKDFTAFDADSTNVNKNFGYSRLPYDSGRDVYWDSSSDDRRFADSTEMRYTFDRYERAYEKAYSIYRRDYYDRIIDRGWNFDQQMKRYIKIDVLVNSLEVDGRKISYGDVHTPPFERFYKMYPTRAAEIMPTFGELYSYNRYDSRYNIRWDNRRAANFYKQNFRRWMALIMEHGPTRNEALKLFHEETSKYAGRY